MPKTEQIAIGALVALLCAAGLWSAGWFVRETPKGQWLARRLGDERAVWSFRALFGLGIVFGLLLAANVIQPVEW